MIGLGVLPTSVASGTFSASASASQAATSTPDIAIRTMPCTPISAKRSASLAHSSTGATVSPFRVRSASPRMLAIAGIAAGK